ncbi:hypothetical protein PFISCL1PPCAC_279 [Pristionchus fissidentatus]|uniref:Uncharacterized protein n=1 Tax=Pristionchus fissidentatus TaxID=1538716 RepID=A0AAV5URX1_9BILA|nr:hypothetical protein PFISCL1PPCAC_279 [Pristionchus fissidentatus]
MVENPKKDPDGTMRQHLIFALCTYANPANTGTGDEFAVMKEIMSIVNEKVPVRMLATFCATDMMHAFKGAVENPVSVPAAIDQFILHAARDPAKDSEAAANEISYMSAEQRRLIEQFKEHSKGYLDYAKDYARDFSVDRNKTRASNMILMMKDAQLLSSFAVTLPRFKY